MQPGKARSHGLALGSWGRPVLRLSHNESGWTQARETIGSIMNNFGDGISFRIKILKLVRP